MSSHRALGLFLFVAIAACGNTAEDGSGSSEGAATSGSASPTDAAKYMAAIGKCNKDHNRAANKATSTVDMEQAEFSWQTCVGKINDIANPKIVEILGKAGSSYKTTFSAKFTAFRKAEMALCDELNKASSMFGGTGAGLEASGCAASRESYIAQLIGTYVAIDDSASALQPDRAHHRACYTAFDQASNTASSTAQMMQANIALSTCIGAQVTALGEGVGKVEVDNDATAGPLATATKRVQDAADAMVKSGAEFCAAMSEAGENGTGTLSRVTATTCGARVVESTYSMLASYIEE